MCKVVSSTASDMLRVNVGREVMNAKISEVFAVRRSLDIEALSNKLGKVLSHSAAVVITNKGPVLVEYMGDSHVYVFKCNDFKSEKHVFKQRGFYFICDKENGEVPNCEITVKMFADKMVELMKNKKFNTFTHNCHHARYRTMKSFGMSSDNPNSEHKNLIVQGFVDVSKKYPKLRLVYANE
ncbi:hypothetical protein TRFO_32300 [Tritrichomonas foetus]|uniref:Uncharacterized protein n=1 Tax=Tritrichomonas foetus TaxID=1144522 RepID=A0A1J4JP37_9EUKA|nr:hypothetical protein TRFO_32300 [Tritrichomonas foetus]|eukprot:OHT00911.1 hypothetical protein TRFO_32300 [Tritrichomonas foetus]